MKKVLAILVGVFTILAVTAMMAAAEDEYEEGGATQAIGGLLNTSDGRLEYRVQADAYWFSNETRMRYFKPGLGNLPAGPEGTIWVGEPFRLELREWPQLTMFSWRKPATITIHYNPDELGGRSESWLRIVRYFDSWVELPMVLDTINHTVTTEVPWGGDYALVAYNSEPATPAPTPAPPEGSGSAASRASGPSSSVGGRIYWDKNTNGVMDGDDSPVANIGVRIGNDSFNAITSTGPDGYYSFSNIPGGTFSVDPIAGAEWDFTTPKSVGGIGVTGEQGSNGAADFGMTYKSWYRPL